MLIISETLFGSTRSFAYSKTAIVLFMCYTVKWSAHLLHPKDCLHSVKLCLHLKNLNTYFNTHPILVKSSLIRPYVGLYITGNSLFLPHSLCVLRFSSEDKQKNMYINLSFVLIHSQLGNSNFLTLISTLRAQHIGLLTSK